jgi:hypothetical protein
MVNNRKGKEMRALVAAVLLVVVALLSLSVGASAQDTHSLKRATAVFAVGAAADWTSTYRFMTADHPMPETNIVMRSFNTHPVAVIAAGAAMDVAGVWAWNHYVGKHHPRVAAIGLYVAGAARIALAVRNEHERSVLQSAYRFHTKDSAMLCAGACR